MNTTDNYSLNQYELTDRVLMSDFNSDNVKIDAALKAQADALAAETAARIASDAELNQKSRFTVLKVIDLHAEGNSLTVSLSDINWSLYDKVHLDFYASNAGDCTVYKNANDSANKLFTIGGTPVQNPLPQRPRITFYPAFKANRQVAVYSSSGYAAISGTTYSDIETLVFSRTFSSGNTLTIIGEI